MSDDSNTELLAQRLGKILPGGATACVREVQECTQEYPEESRHLAQAAQQRRNEFSTGRVCARNALYELGVAAVALDPDPDGVPVWPLATLGSISHSRGLCAAVAAKTDTYSCIGLDLEKINRLTAAAMKRVVTSDESSWVGDDQLLGSLLFSAKEAFYKSQFPRWRCPGNFHDVTLSVDPSNATLKIAALSPVFPSDMRAKVNDFELRYGYFGNYVVTLCWLEAGDSHALRKTKSVS